MRSRSLSPSGSIEFVKVDIISKSDFRYRVYAGRVEWIALAGRAAGLFSGQSNSGREDAPTGTRRREGKAILANSRVPRPLRHLCRRARAIGGPPRRAKGPGFALRAEIATCGQSPHGPSSSDQQIPEALSRYHAGSRAYQLVLGQRHHPSPSIASRSALSTSGEMSARTLFAYISNNQIRPSASSS